MSSQHLSVILTQFRPHHRLCRRYYTSSTINLRNHDSNDYSKTVFVPRSNFPPRHDPEAELKVQEDRQFAQAYLEQNPARKPHVIHDGPPFANGPIHLGHAINKILKDIAARYAMITGNRVEFITGWDCHGLPIELQVLKLIEEQQSNSNYGGNLLLDGVTSPEHFRTKARAYAKSQIDLQMAAFKRIGLLTDWNKRYTTDDPSYVANQLRAFSHLYEQKLIFKDLMPVNWSLSNQTTLSDADVEYRNNHVSKSAYVLCEIIDAPFSADVPGQQFYALVWTTTPWTLLENQAIAFNKQETYCLIKIWNDITMSATKYLVVSNDSIHKVQELLQRLGYMHEVKTYLPGRSLVGLRYKPLLNDLVADNQHEADDTITSLPFLDADFVEGAKGTGLVHMAPNYGFEDFNLFRKNKLKTKKSLVDTSGRYVDRAGSELSNKHIFTDGTEEILNLLNQHEALLFTELTRHSYPYETRTNQPIIIRSSSQVFLDTARIIPKCLKLLESCSFYPENRRTQLINTLTSSPSWCISRQRIWGTPIPVFYHKHDETQSNMIHHPKIIDHLCKVLYKKRFMDYWWTLDNSELIPNDLLEECKIPYKSEDLVRGTDIFDVWSDSGLSWHTLTGSLNDSKDQADLFLEGIDQIRGWFSASSVLSVALRGCLPSKRFFVHGFALDPNGKKMSKSQGNVVDPADLFRKYGVDPVRLWVAKLAGSNRDICVEPKVFESSIDHSISKIRLILKFLIGALDGHEMNTTTNLDHTKLQLFDQYYLDKLYRLASDMDEHYKNYNYDTAADTIVDFIAVDLSPVYLNTIKDILYCDDFDSGRRLSCLTVLDNTYNILLRCLYPLVPHIVHEAINYKSLKEPLNEWQDLGYKAAWKNDVLHNQFELLVKMKSVINNLLGQKQVDLLKDYHGNLVLCDKKFYKHLSKVITPELDTVTQLFKTSSLTLTYNENLTEPDKQVQKTHQATEEISLDAGDQFMDVEESFNLISSWSERNASSIRVGGLISLKGSKPIKFEMNYEKSDCRKCPRCRLFRIPNKDEHANCCDRCKSAMQKLELLV